ncbi:transposase [Arthrobacter sp. NPDC057013]|uniref:IS110 family transposase n=1 Tax=Arthrobacter sp. NPDC057013 TaxID=3345999 RepID=UPI003629BA03
MRVLSTRRRQRDIHVIRQEATHTLATDTLVPARSGHMVIGVDTHKHVHVAAVMDPIGGILDTLTVTTDSAGFGQLLGWAVSFGKIIAFGVEGTGSYGAGLTSFIRRQGHKVVEVNPADRRMRRLAGKSDAHDAKNAARAVLAGFGTAVPTTADGTVEMIRELKIAHDTGREGPLRGPGHTQSYAHPCPEQMRKDTAEKTQVMLARYLGAMRPRAMDTPEDSIRHALRSIGRRWQNLDAEA